MRMVLDTFQCCPSKNLTDVHAIHSLYKYLAVLLDDLAMLLWSYLTISSYLIIY